MSEKLPKNYGSRLGKVSELPDAVKSQLRLSQQSQCEGPILDVLAHLGGAATRNELLVHLWERHKITIERRELESVITRMKKKGQIAHGLIGAQGGVLLPHEPQP